MDKIKDFITENKKAVIITAIVIVVLLLGVGAAFAMLNQNQPEEEPVAVEETPEPEEEAADSTEEEADATEEEEEQLPEGMVLSKLTGEPVSEEIGTKRPIALMINNIKDAIPQSGISSADVIYEAPVEGGITRMMAIFENMDGVEKIGSIRSCRLYYLYYALEFDAIYGHAGQAIYADDLLAEDFVNNLSAQEAPVDGICYFRTKDHKAPHNLYTSPEKLEKGIKAMKYRRDYEEDYEGHYLFCKEGESASLYDTKEANYVAPGYVINHPYFEYHEDDGLYYRYQYGGEHIDALNDNQLAFKNIILQYSKWEDYGDGYLKFDTGKDAYGKGYYITDGKAEKIEWSKDGEYGVTHYYGPDGKEITLNRGKTFVCIIQNTYKKRCKIGKTNSEME